MKNLKKVLAMVLAFACTFTMFASAKVYEDVEAGSDYSEAITMLSDLGIIQGKTDSKYHPRDTITRAEACMLITRLMTGDPTAAGFEKAHTFKDVPAGYWASSAIGYCVVNGVTVGVDAAGTRFEPNRPIKDKEFVTMVVRALGYETPDMKLDFPFGYMSAARAIGLLHNVNMIPETDALRDEDAQVIYNAMFADYARGAKRLNVAHGTSVETYPTLAESVWHLDRAAVGTWDKKDNNDETATLSNCKAHTWVVIGHDPDEKNRLLAYPIKDDSSDLYDSKEKNAFRTYSFKYEGEGDIESIKGYQVELWGAGTHGEPTWDKGDNKFVYSNDWTIKAIKTVKGQSKFDYNPGMADKKIDDGKIELEEKSLDLGSVAGNAKNVSVAAGGALDQFVAKDYNDESKMDKDEKVEAALNIRDGAQYRLMDWNSDGDIDWIVVDTANYYKVESVTAKSVTVSWMKPEMKWETSKTSEKQTWKRGDSTKFDGDFDVKYEIPEDVKEGDILEVTYKTTPTSEKTYEGKVAVVDAENHKLEKVSTKGGLSLTFDDKEIKVAQDNDKGDVIVPKNPAIYRDFNNEELGTEFALHLNRNGFILHSDYVTERASYAMVLDTKNGSDRVSDRSYGEVDLLTANNEHLKNVEFTSNAVVTKADGKKDSIAYDNRVFTEENIVGNVYKYWTNDDGQITKMRQVIEPADMKSNVDASDYSYKADADTLKDAQGKYVASLKDADVLFAVKPAVTEGNKFEGDQKPVYDNTNAGYIQSNGNGDFFVDVDDVLAVEQSDIPDIVKSTSTDTDTHAAYLDNKRTNRTKTWLGANNNGAQNDYINRFVAQLDKNGDASAAILGVENFNKFNAGSTKIGLVTDVTYSNSADGKYVEMTAAFGGENKTIESAKKVDFDDVVKVYDARAQKDVDVASPSDTAKNNLFKGKAFDKYLEDNAAYAEITTDKDGKLTKLTFLDQTTDNELAGHYYTVSRNITVSANEKAVNYLHNDGAKSAADGITNTAKQYYANENDLISVPEGLPNLRGAFASDATFYSIKGKATRSDKKYDNKRLTVVDGFERTPDITAGGTYSVIEHSNIDNESNDYYAVADIVLNNGDDVAAVYAFEDTFGEEHVDGVAIVTMKDNKGVAITEAKPGDSVKLEAVVVDVNTAKRIDSLKIVDPAGMDVTADWQLNNQNVSLTGREYYADATVPVNAVNGKHTIYAIGTDGKEYKIGALEVTVNNGRTLKYTVSAIEFAKADGSATTTDLVTVPGNKNQFVVYVSGAEEKARAASTPVEGLTKDNFKVTFGSNGVQPTVTAADPVKGAAGYYTLSLSENVDKDREVKVTVIAGGSAVSVASGVEVKDASPEFGVEGGETTPGTGSEEAQKAADLAVNVKGGAVTTLEVVVTDADKNELKNLVKDDFNLTVDGRHVKNFEVKFVANKYEITSTEVPDWTKAKDIVMTVGGRTETYGVVANAPSIKVEGSDAEYELGSMADDAWYTVEKLAIKLENIPMEEVTVTDVVGVSEDAVKIEDGKIKLSTTALNKLSKDTEVKFKLTDGTTSTKVKTVTVKEHKVTVTGGTFDAAAKTVTLNLDKAPNAAVQEALKGLQLKAVGADNIYTAGTALVKDVTVNEKAVVVTLLTNGAVKLNQAAEVDAEKVFEAVVVDGAKFDLGTGKKIDLGKKTLTVGEVTGTDSTKTVTMDLGLSKEEAEALKKEIAANYTQYIVIKSGTKNSETANAVTAITVQEDGKLELTVTTDLTTGQGLKYEFKGSDLYAPIPETAANDIA